MDTEIERLVHTIARGGDEAVFGAIQKLFARLSDQPGPNLTKKLLVNRLLYEMRPGEVVDLLWGAGLATAVAKHLDPHKRIVITPDGRAPTEEFAPAYQARSETGRSSSGFPQEDFDYFTQ